MLTHGRILFRLRRGKEVSAQNDPGWGHVPPTLASECRENFGYLTSIQLLIFVIDFAEFYNIINLLHKSHFFFAILM